MHKSNVKKIIKMKHTHFIHFFFLFIALAFQSHIVIVGVNLSISRKFRNNKTIFYLFIISCLKTATASGFRFFFLAHQNALSPLHITNETKYL